MSSDRCARLGVHLALLWLAALAGLFQANSTYAQAQPPALFSRPVIAIQADRQVVRDRQVIRAREVLINAALLSGARDLPGGFFPGGQGILFNLFDELAVVVVPTRIVPFERGLLWIGSFRDNPLGQVILIVSGEVVSGNITLPGARFHIRYVGNGLHETQEIDQRLFPADEPGTPVPPASTAEAPPPKRTKADDGSTIDVMVAYTATARAAAGGTAAIQSLIDLAIAETNQSYANSAITQRLRLVHSVEVAYTESGDVGTDLDRVTDVDGIIDNVHTLRDTYGADLVSLWVDNGGGYCGVGWFMDTVSPTFAPYGYNVVDRGCATGYYSFAHELGHNMGARHDTYMDPGTTPYPYAHGYTRPAATPPWRTIMAYNNACEAVLVSCMRTQYWSNPSVSYGGIPMGDSAADNQQTLDNTAYTVANFRATVAMLPGAPTIGVASPGTNSGSIAFSPPGSNGGAPIDNYRATCNPGGITGTGGASPIIVGGLSNGVSYTCTVAAHNSVGWGPESSASNAFVPSAPVQRSFVAAQSGNDANLGSGCASATPCKTFAAALGVVASGGEIVALQTGNYGSVLVNKSVALIGAPGVHAGIVASSGGAAVEVSGAGTRLSLRNLAITGVGATHGVVMASGAVLALERVTVSGFASGNGISVSTGAAVQIADCVLRDNLIGAYLINGVTASITRSKFLGNANNGILVGGNAAGTTTRAAISQVLVTGSGSDWGISVQSLLNTATVRAQVTRSAVSGSFRGLVANSTAGGVGALTVNRSRVSGNGTGLYQSGAGATLRTRGNNTLSNNTANSSGSITPLPGQ
ncbi:hypothetical protein BURK2_04112 [Burkholderiales bacterium]|nr:MAG: hypothetical protein F9K47_00840 [Burkholderiales bacterium]CAG1010791.1 hypothetical protein BURK2_04112 [Burkholderiales bacterium]